jgi:hypothetical protein
MRRHRRTLIREAGFHSESTADADDALSDASVQFLWDFPGAYLNSMANGLPNLQDR